MTEDEEADKIIAKLRKPPMKTYNIDSADGQVLYKVKRLPTRVWYIPPLIPKITPDDTRTK